MDSTERTVTYESVPRWLRLTGRAGQIVILTFLAVIMLSGYFIGILPNLFLVLLFVGPVVFLVGRAAALFNGNLRRPSLRASGAVHVLPRVVFWCLVATVCWIGLVPAQLEASERAMVSWMPAAFGVVVAVLSLVPRRVPNWPFTVFAMAGSALLMAAVVLAVREPTADVVEIGFPMAGQTHMLQAGPTPLTNYHALHPGQRNAIDMAPIGDGGTAEEGDALTDDACFGAALIAVADGVVRFASDDEADLPIGESSDGHAAGNRVVLEIAPDRYALYAHLKQGSALVSEGHRVREGDKIGECGNTGNTSGPHLHFQVQDKVELFDKGNRSYPVVFRNTVRIREGRTTRGRPVHLRRKDIVMPDDTPR